MNSRRGSVIIYIMMIFLALQVLIFSFIHFSREKTVSSSVNSLGNLWGQAILSEYDVNLYEEYGIFGFLGYEREINDKLAYYADFTFNRKKYISYEKATSHLEEYSLINRKNVAEQIIKAAKLNHKNVYFKGGEESEEAYERKIKSKYCGILRNERVIRCLPSKSKSEESIMLLPMDKLLVSKYINTHFEDLLSKGEGKTLFSYEREYILSGFYKDSANLNSVKFKLGALRTASNLAYLLSDKEKCAKALAMAKLITGGKDIGAVQFAILSGWAVKESMLDVNVLMSGKVVPLKKTKVTWGKKETWKEGKNYDYYLNILIGMMSSEKLTDRIMDLIQLNMKLNYYEDFQLRDYSCGLVYSLKVNGDVHEFKKVYEK